MLARMSIAKTILSAISINFVEATKSHMTMTVKSLQLNLPSVKVGWKANGAFLSFSTKVTALFAAILNVELTKIGRIHAV